jgi:hypothetical protein
MSFNLGTSVGKTYLEEISAVLRIIFYASLMITLDGDLIKLTAERLDLGNPVDTELLWRFRRRGGGRADSR